MPVHRYQSHLLASVAALLLGLGPTIVWSQDKPRAAADDQTNVKPSPGAKPAADDDADDEASDDEAADNDAADDDDDDDDAAPASQPAPDVVEESGAAAPPSDDDSPLSDEERAAARPPLAEVTMLPEPSWEQHIAVGGSVAFVSRPFVQGLEPSDIRYAPAVGWGVHLHWQVFHALWFHPYLYGADHSVVIPTGGLVSGAGNAIHPAATVEDITVSTFAFGAKLAPTFDLSERARVWLSVGVGWGRFEIPDMTVTEPDGGAFLVSERTGVFVEFPIGIGFAFDIVPRWLAVEYEVIGAPVAGQSGSAHESAQAVDEDGQLRDIGVFGAVEANFVQTLGLSLLL